MIQYGQDITTGTELATQVCIVGMGAAGITLAWHLLRAGVKVILIDGGRVLQNGAAPFCCMCKSTFLHLT